MDIMNMHQFQKFMNISTKTIKVFMSELMSMIPNQDLPTKTKFKYL